MNIIELGKLLKLARQQKGLTQEQLAETLSVTTSAISKWENGKNLPDSDMLLKLALTLGLSIEDLYYPEKTLERLTNNSSPQKRPKHFKLVIGISILIGLFVIIGISCYIYHEKHNLDVRPVAYRVVKDEIINVEVHEVACFYKGDLDNPILDDFLELSGENWQNDTFVSESIIYQKMSFYKDYEAALAFDTPDQSFYLVRHK
ncbi:MAG: helix-turn-helix transcriptional regulator [Lachnospiraceae bacterium]|nr:helix-turn-helix transcriptional regulator [Lachnospiraceae bacterium]